MLKIINDLHDAMTVQKGAEASGRTLKSLVDYSRYHFSEEERLMSKYGYEGYAAHKGEHEAFIKSVLDMSERHARGDGSVTIALISFLKSWFSKHIRNTDNKYGEFFNNLGVR